MKIKFAFQKPVFILVTSAVLLFSSFACSLDSSDGDTLSAAPSSYGILAEKSLDLMAEFDLDTWGTMLSDSVVFYFPDAGEENSEKLIGKKALLNWWKNYINTSGIKSMSIDNASYMPICVRKGMRKSDLSGTQVIAYFSNKLVYDSGAVSVRMNFVIHFDQNKMIDGYYTYYDQTQINKMQKDKNVPKVLISVI